MRLVLLSLSVCAGVIGFAPAAGAQNYPWCAYYRSGGTNCGFSTYAQCASSLGGGGDTCMQNTQYHGPAGRAATAPSVRQDRPKPPEKPKPQEKPQEKLIAPQPQ